MLRNDLNYLDEHRQVKNSVKGFNCNSRKMRSEFACKNDKLNMQFYLS